jgi:DHA1 family tetracycline resistance protein-like MFS transporter
MSASTPHSLASAPPASHPHPSAPSAVPAADSWPRMTVPQVRSMPVAPLHPNCDDEGEHSLNAEEVAALEREIALAGDDEDFDGSSSWVSFVLLAALYIFLLNIPGGIYNAIMGNMQQDFFAGQSCEGSSDTPVCSKANSQSTVLNGIGDGLGAVLALLSSPLVGRLSDAYGRKPFVIIAALLIFLPAVCISLYWLFGFSMWWFIVISNMASLLDPPFIMLAFLADQVPQRHRAVSFGVLISMTQLPTCVGALITTFCSWNVGLWIQLISAALGLLLACLLPESLPVTRRVTMPPAFCSQLNPFPLIRVLFRYKMFARLGGIVLLNSFAAQGVSSILSAYLIQQLDASTQLQSEFLLYLGFLGFLVGTLGMAALTRIMSNRMILFIGCIFTTAVLPLLAIGGSHVWQYWLPLGLLALSNVVFPAASALKSLNCSASEQGKVQGESENAAVAHGPVTAIAMRS